MIHPEDVEAVVGKWRSSLATGRPLELKSDFGGWMENTV